LQFYRGGGLALDVVLDFGGAERHENVIMIMSVEERGLLRRDFYLEDADELVFKYLVVMGLGGDFELGGLCDQGDGE
jgi:hypothetical protein